MAAAKLHRAAELDLYMIDLDLLLFFSNAQSWIISRAQTLETGHADSAAETRAASRYVRSAVGGPTRMAAS